MTKPHWHTTVFNDSKYFCWLHKSSYPAATATGDKRSCTQGYGHAKAAIMNGNQIGSNAARSIQKPISKICNRLRSMKAYSLLMPFADTIWRINPRTRKAKNSPKRSWNPESIKKPSLISSLAWAMLVIEALAVAIAEGAGGALPATAWLESLESVVSPASCLRARQTPHLFKLGRMNQMLIKHDQIYDVYII